MFSYSTDSANQQTLKQESRGRDVEAAVSARRDTSDSNEDEKESPEMNLVVALGILFASTGLTC